MTCNMDCPLHVLSFDWVHTVPTGEALVISNNAYLLIDQVLNYSAATLNNKTMAVEKYSLIEISYFFQVEFDHSGQYQCYVRINDGSVISDPVSVSVVGPPYIDIEDDMENITANVGDNLDVDIYFCSQPPATASWVVRIGEGDNQLLMLSGRKHGRFSTQTRWYK